MAKPYPTLPMSVTDELNNLNGALAAYDLLMSAWIEQGDSGPKHFSAGCSYLLRSVIEGYESIADEVEMFRKLGTVSVLTIPDQETDA
ncbi:hypothetical protein [Pseudomonas pseudonitroreducens]|uniref:hypothetical protein n=1 Tax=Pseudomonas pseudonitroreducens TaxID=2892326 RepID=UPI001F1B83DB|nr:hypothetical protein [Pseudomonas pseudonitroreducens]